MIIKFSISTPNSTTAVYLQVDDNPEAIKGRAAEHGKVNPAFSQSEPGSKRWNSTRY